jgi:hypothetical protein
MTEYESRMARENDKRVRDHPEMRDLGFEALVIQVMPEDATSLCELLCWRSG